MLLSEDKIVLVVSLPLLDGENSFEVLNLPVAYPDRGKAVSKHRLEANNIAVNLVGTKFKLLEPEEACSMNVLKEYSMKNLIYTTSGYQKSVMELFKGHIDMIPEVC